MLVVKGQLTELLPFSIYARGHDLRARAAAAHRDGVAICRRERLLRIDVGPVWIVGEIADAEALAALQPDLEALSAFTIDHEATGVTVFAASNDKQSAIHVRSFAPAHGVPEDPVCGSGNICVAAYLKQTNAVERFGESYVARQGMQVGRDGRVLVRLDEDGIRIGGHAVTCVEGTLKN